MQNKLQELTDRLYNEGLSKGKAEGEQILDNARNEAATILENARKEAEDIKANASREAEEMKSKVLGDLKTASEQMLQATRKDIENAIVCKISDKGISEAASDPEFLKELIKAVAEKFSSENSQEMSLILPESLKGKLEPFVAGELKNSLKNGIRVDFSKKIAGGFNIGPAEGGWFISFSDESFKSLISEYLRPVTRKFLFSE